jgi:hypothetical protein
VKGYVTKERKKTKKARKFMGRNIFFGRIQKNGNS